MEGCDSTVTVSSDVPGGFWDSGESTSASTLPPLESTHLVRAPPVAKGSSKQHKRVHRAGNKICCVSQYSSIFHYSYIETSTIIIINNSKQQQQKHNAW